MENPILYEIAQIYSLGTSNGWKTVHNCPSNQTDGMDALTEVSASIKKQEKKIVESLTKKTHFSSQEIERLLNLYRTTVVTFLFLKSLHNLTFLIGEGGPGSENRQNGQKTFQAVSSQQF